jgi:DNA-binding XRE family transcriptional regulator
MTADELRALRKRLGMTQAQLAEALGKTVGSISNYEGARGPYEIPHAIELALHGAVYPSGSPAVIIMMAHPCCSLSRCCCSYSSEPIA